MADEQKKRREINVGFGPAAPVAVAGLTNPVGRASPAAAPRPAPGQPSINIGFGQSRAVEPAPPRAAPLGVRLLRGDFQMTPKAPRAETAQPEVNVGLPAPQRTLEPPRTPRALPPATLAATVAPVAAPAAAAPSFANVTGGARQAERLLPGDMNTFTGSDGVTRRVDPAPAASAAAPAQQIALRTPAVEAAPSAAPQVQQSVRRALDTQRDLTRTTRADASEMLNPMGADAEILRRLENSQSSYFNKGRPSARRLIGEAIAGQLGARNAASAQGQRAGNETAERGVGFEFSANEGAARRQLDADTFNADSSYRDRTLAAEQGRPSQLVRGLDGTTSILRNDGSVGTLRDEAGNPIQTPEQAAGALTPAALLDSYTQQSRAINEGLGTPEEKAQQQAALRSDPIFSALFQQQQASIPSGTVRGGYRFKGGDPAQQSNWEKVK